MFPCIPHSFAVNRSQETTRRLHLLRLILLFSAFVWGISTFGVFLNWETALGVLQDMGANLIAYDRMLNYWLPIAPGAFALVGTDYLLLAISPLKYAVMLPWFGCIMIAEGVILLSQGLRLGLNPFPFSGEVSASFAGVLGILLLKNSARAND